jgi:zinc transporter ZupT
MVGMTWLEGRAFFIHHPDVIGLLIAFESDDAKNQWFLPMLFFAAFLVQLVHLLRTEKKCPSHAEITCGFLGGIANGAATFFLMLSTEFANAIEHPMIFPVFAVLVVVLCNLWGQWFYKEKVNWKANLLCVVGLFIGTFNWSQLNLYT